MHQTLEDPLTRRSGNHVIEAVTLGVAYWGGCPRRDEAGLCSRNSSTSAPGDDAEEVASHLPYDKRRWRTAYVTAFVLDAEDAALHCGEATNRCACG
jgi:hypothetical protein